MKICIKTLSALVLLMTSSAAMAQNRTPRVVVMPQLQLKGISQGKTVVAFVVNGKVPLISTGGVATINWVNGRSEHVEFRRGDLVLPSFDYVDHNIHVVRVKSNYLVLLALDSNKATPAFLSRQIDDPRCPLVPPSRDLGFDPNAGCVVGDMSPYMNDIIGFVSLDRVLSDPAVRNNRPVLLQKGVDF